MNRCLHTESECELADHNDHCIGKDNECPELKGIKRLQEIGHTHHCACRIHWGDGECECGFIKRTEA